MTRWLCLVQLVLLASTSPAHAKPSDAEKAKTKAEKKLDAFEKTYDPSKDLSRKNPEKLEKDIAELDEVVTELKDLDVAGFSELSARKDALVAKAKEGVSSATAGKNDEVFAKHFAKTQEQVDPEKKHLENMDASTIKRLKEELDRDIAKFDPSQRKPYEDKRDALFSKLTEDIAKAKVGNLRSVLAKPEDVAPLPGIEPIKPMSPTWCEGVDKALAGFYSNYRAGNLNFKEDSRGPGAFVQAVTFSCQDPEHDVRQKLVAAWRQQVSNRYGLSAAKNDTLMKLGAKLVIAGATGGTDADAQQKEMCTTKLPFIITGPFEKRYTRHLEREGVDCHVGIGAPVETREMRPSWVDVPDGVGSALAGAVLAQRLINQGFHTEDGKLTGFAVANAVIPFDASTFESELAAWNFNEAGTINATLSFYGAAQRMKELAVQAKARNAAILIDAPKKGVAAFTANLAKNRPSIDLALALEDQKRTGSLKGCAVKLYPELVAAVKGQKESFDELRLEGLLAYKLALCGLGDPDAPEMGTVFTYYSDRSVPVRGPFTAAYLALMDAHNASSGNASAGGGFDPRAARGAGPAKSGPFVPDSNPIEPENLEHGNTISTNVMPTGIVKAVEKKGELATITFRTEHYLVPDLECHETNKIDRILPDGSILYRSSCKKVGEHMTESTNEPITVPSYAANGVGPGSFLLYHSAPVNNDVKGQPHRGWVIEAYESPARKTRTSLFGITP